LATAQAQGARILAFAGTSSGAATAAGQSASIASAAGTAAGAATAAAQGASTASAVGTAAGVAVVIGYSPSLISTRFAFPGDPANGGTIEGGFGVNGFTIKRGDTAPAIRYALEPATVDLTGATVRFQMRARNGSVILDVGALVVTATGTPTVEYSWQAGDTATAGLYEAEFRVTYADGKIETFPNGGFIRVGINQDV
jgi:hypothetical protein